MDKSRIPNVGGDASSNLSWIISNYRTLPKWCLFIHAHEVHWHHARYSQLRSMRIDLESAGRGFLSVSHVADGSVLYFRKDLLAELTDDEHTSLRRELLGLQTPYSGRVRHTPCGTFWVRRDRIWARPRAFYQKLYDAMTDAHHPLLSRSAAAEGYPARMLHVFFIEGYWHYIFGEAEEYSLPFQKYDAMPLLPASNPAVEERAKPSAQLDFPPLKMTRGGLAVHLRKQQQVQPLRNVSGSSRLLLAKVTTQGCDCLARRKAHTPEPCRRAADAAIRLLVKVGDERRLPASSDYCGALDELLTPLAPDARGRIRSLSQMCFGGVGGPRDYALAALVSCMLPTKG